MRGFILNSLNSDHLAKPLKILDVVSQQTRNIISIITELVGQKDIMNISSSNKFSRKYIPNVKSSNYDFNRFDKAALKNIVSVLKLFIITESYSNWKRVDLFFRALIERFYSNGLDVYCFIVSPYWKNNTRIVRHYGLGRILEKEFKLKPLNFLIEKEIINDNHVIFYGVLKLSPANARRAYFICFRKMKMGCYFLVKAQMILDST